MTAQDYLKTYTSRRNAGTLSVAWMGNGLCRFTDTELGTADFTPGWLDSQRPSSEKSAVQADLGSLSRPAPAPTPTPPPEDPRKTRGKSALQDWGDIRTDKEAATRDLFAYLLHRLDGEDVDR